MKILLGGIMLFVLTCFCSSCHTSSSTPAPDVLYIPWDIELMMPSHNVVPVGHSLLTTNGILVACKVSGIIPDTNGVPYTYTGNWEAAMFKTPLSNTLTGAVSDVRFNGVPLTTNDSAFIHRDSSPLWIEGGSNTWHVGGSAYVPAFDTSTSAPMPSFSGTLPAIISSAAEFTYTFNSTNTANADSAYVMIRGDIDPLNSNVVSASGGIAKIPATLMAHATNCTYCSLTYPYSNPYYKGGLIAFVLYNHKTITVGTKQFDIVNQRVYLGNFNKP